MNHPGTAVDPETVLLVAETRRRKDSISLGIAAAVIIAVIVASFALGGLRSGIPPAGWVVMFGALFGQWVFSARNARCPSCDNPLGRMIRAARFCPHCGVRVSRTETP
jgi:hypothetical protein